MLSPRLVGRCTGLSVWLRYEPPSLSPPRGDGWLPGGAEITLPWTALCLPPLSLALWSLNLPQPAAYIRQKGKET